MGAESLPLGGGRIHSGAKDCLLNRLGGLARDLGDLAHPVGAEGKHDAGQPCHVAEERIKVPFDEAAVAEQRLDARPFALGGHARVHLEPWCMALRRVEWTLRKDSLSSESCRAGSRCGARGSDGDRAAQSTRSVP